jgi:hypothetical protein
MASKTASWCWLIVAALLLLSSAGMRKQYADFAARDRDQAGSDPAACQRVADRSAVLAAMAARSRELLERGRLVVEGRDNEVQLLLGTVNNDRSLLRPAP